MTEPPRREELLREPVEDITISPEMTLGELVEAYGKAWGFMAGHLYRAVEVLAEGLREADLRVLSFTANIVATGVRGVIRQLLEEGLFNLVVTTCGTIDHDVARGTGGRYYKGYFEADDVMLHDLEIHRLGNIFIPVEDYGPRVERLVYRVLDELPRDREWSVYEILWEVGRRLPKDSILRVAAEKGVPVIVPGFLDGAFGTALYTYRGTHPDLKINPFKDEDVMANAFFGAEKAAALIIGGGISKHHVIWWAQFKGGLDYAVYITTAVEYDGSLSGAQPREAITWGKLKPGARSVVVYADATIVLPILAAGVLAKLRR